MQIGILLGLRFCLLGCYYTKDTRLRRDLNASDLSATDIHKEFTPRQQDYDVKKKIASELSCNLSS